jgi:CIC family chloride channel protein
VKPDAEALREPRDTPGEVRESGLAVLALLSVGTGAGIGLLVACFRLALERGDAFRDALIAWPGPQPLPGLFVASAAGAGATALAVWLVRRFARPAAGSGIPQVEAVIDAELPPSPPCLVPVKFVGGVLAMGAGLALGREGPSVHIGAGVSWLSAGLFRVSERDRLALVAAGAGAGLAVAFNAPIAGAVFVLEELVRRFDTRIAVAALGASSAAIGVAQMLIGRAADFSLPPLAHAPLGSGPLFAGLGVVAGLAGVAYSRAILGSSDVAGRLPLRRPEGRAAVIGAAVGALAWLAPGMVGGGAALTREILGGSVALAAIVPVFAVRFLLGPVSYAAGAPGGLFAPMLTLGAQIGLAFGLLSQAVVGDLAAPPVAFALAGMAAFFTSVVRAPVTGIILSVELTAAYNQFLPMLWASFAAMTVATLLASPPIYDSLKARAVARASGRPR